MENGREPKMDGWQRALVPNSVRGADARTHLSNSPSGYDPRPRGRAMSSARTVSRAAAGVARVFYRLEVVGERPPAAGPLLLVANHPNSLLDTALVTLATGRPARFLAKSTLFDDVKVGWLVRASGAIPVYRQQDAGAAGEPGVGRAAGNAAMFRAAEGALGAGDAIALFPEGISHVNPSLAPLKTGAARLALGAARRLGAFPIVPVGITLDDRAVFRSTGLLVVGAPVAWDDLATRAVATGDADDLDLDHDLVRALTARIDDALHAVTAGYASWEDARLVAAAERVHAAAVEAARLGLPGAGGKTPLVAQIDPLPPLVAGARADDASVPADRLGRYHLGAALLVRAHAAEGAAGDDARAAVADLARALRGHERLLGVLRLTPGDLAVPTDLGTAFGWARRRAYLAILAGLAAVGAAIGWVPYRLTGVIAARMAGPDERDVLATAKVLVGGVCFLVWTVLLAVVAGVVVAWWAGVLVLLLVPPLLVLTLVASEGWQFAWRDARRFLVLRRRRDRAADLRTQQAALARLVERVVARLDELRADQALNSRTVSPSA